MNRLIKNELIKIFKKKGIYIALLITLAFIILTNCIYKFSHTEQYSYYSYQEDYVQYLEEELSKLNPENESDTEMYISLKSQIELMGIMEKYEKKAWQRQIVADNLTSYIEEKNEYTFGKNKNIEESNKIQTKIEDIIKKLDSDDWMYFAEQDLEKAKQNLKDAQEQKENTKDKQQLQNIELSIKDAEIGVEVAKYRIEKEIKYGNDYLNEALAQYKDNSRQIIMQDGNTENLKYDEKKAYNSTLAKREINKYIIENKKDINKKNDTRGILKDIFSEYGIFIIVIITIIAGTIVSEEFNKGTVKLLLVKPYTRSKILLAKLIVTFFIVIFSIISVIVMELLVGGIIFGYDSLSVPILEYNFETNSLETINIFTYLGIQIFAQLPIYILLATLAFACSTIFNNSPIAIVIPLLGYMSADIINALIIQFKVEFMKYFVSMNWNFNEYLYGNLPEIEGMTKELSMIICLVYFAIMIIPTFIVFKNKNIKNI